MKKDVSRTDSMPKRLINHSFGSVPLLQCTGFVVLAPVAPNDLVMVVANGKSNRNGKPLESKPFPGGGGRSSGWGFGLQILLGDRC